MGAGLTCYFGCSIFLWIGLPSTVSAIMYITLLSAGFIFLLTAGVWITRLLKDHTMDDVFNEQNESFMQETKLITNEYSVNLPTRFQYKGKYHRG